MRAPRLASLRMVLLVLAVIPSVALVVLWLVSTERLADAWQLRERQDALGERTGRLSTLVSAGLQAERQRTTELLAGSDASRTRLAAARRHTDELVDSFLARTRNESEAPAETRAALSSLRRNLRTLPEVRRAVDQGSLTQRQVYRSYTRVIRSSLVFHEALGETNDAEFTRRVRPLTELLWAQEMIAREHAILIRGWAGGRLSGEELGQVADHIGAQRYLFEVRIVPHLSERHAESFRALTASRSWQAKEELEQAVLQAGSHDIPRVLRTTGRWENALGEVAKPLGRLAGDLSRDLGAASEQSLADLRDRLVTYSVIGLGAVVVVVVLTVRLTISLRRRVLGLRDEAARLESDLPAVLDRMLAGEKVDVDAEAPMIDHGDDELGQLGRALNQSRRRLLESAVRDIEQHQAFQRLLQRLARRTQILIGLQLRKLDEMERRHEDPEVLEGLFDLDHLTARLRRYEENMVILGGGQPQRRWRQPVRVVDVLRAALGEVQDYRRVQIEAPEDLWLAGRAVGPVVHVLAELMENATSFSKPPSPVETRAARVPRGIVVEVEDRGLGMAPEEYERCNRMMAGEQLSDMLSRADDVRLGLFVVARLAANLGLSVEFRPSVFGGTRVIVVIPTALVADGPGDADRDAGRARGDTGRVVREGPRTPTDSGTGQAPGEASRAGGTPRNAGPPPAGAPAGHVDGTATDTRATLPTRHRGQAMRKVTGADTASGAPADARPQPTPHSADDCSAPPAAGDGATGAGGPAEEGTRPPLPRRVRQASLVAELRRPPRRRAEETPAPAASPERSGATVAAFQRQSRLAHRGVRQQQEDASATGTSTPDDRSGTEDRG